ncbi:plasmid partitioning protein RepB C-terminal domain-containing protein [Sphingobium sp. CR2-8]|uniref:plasmid partitioning protein RepB C-terminal domain-containing protein n=1 Tax=Sphingobium sp. CR2-8 TaxID=1306534 RepID=UPI002DBBAC42|nr:plasmid partitioning protein RepB C-terminal domain-containing protein [Sphingobium sp. CR2-8]MEC3910053.1 plasmid partitioning protein RepB C-terminal domain-containing protein [Sphingobium sp. CR2-8]
MTNARPAQKVEWIALDRITVVNPRVRNKKVFKEIVDNIAQIGLKRPITVTRRVEADGPFYDLVCGQGRLEAYLALGQKEVPALVVSADPEDCLIASLVENCARRQHTSLDLLHDIGGMRERGHSCSEIARKTGLTFEYVSGVSRLLEQGEERLLRAVEARVIPVSTALAIANAKEHEVQRALQEAYETGQLKGKRLLAAKRIVETRRRYGREVVKQASPHGERMSSAALMRAYEDDVTRKKDMIRRANATRSRLMIIVEAVRQLKNDTSFTALLEREGMSSMPERLAQRVDVLGVAS